MVRQTGSQVGGQAEGHGPVGRTVHEVRLVLPLGEGVVLGRAVAHVGVRPVELVGVAHVHAVAVLPLVVVGLVRVRPRVRVTGLGLGLGLATGVGVVPGVVVDHVEGRGIDGGAPVARLGRGTLGEAAACVVHEAGRRVLVEGADVLVLGAQVPVHVDRAPAIAMG